MKAFIWDQTFVTGIEKVDEQHHFLVDLMNRFGDALIASKSLDDGELASIFGQLAEYAQYHFSTEHNLMLEWGVAPEHRDRHDRLHESFIRQVSAMWNERSTMSNPSEVLHGFLCAWLAFHVLGEDQIMGRQIALIRQGKSPEEAFALASKPLDNSTAGLLEALSNLYGVLAEQNQNLISTNARLGERVKELRCLSEISELAASAKKGLQEILEDAVRLIPNGWCCPAITCARILFKKQTYITENFRETPWHMHADIVSAEGIVGGVDVFYLEERPALDEGPFMKEERSLLNGLARTLGAVLERKAAEEIFNQFFDQPMGLHLIMRRDGLILRVNSSWKQVLGYDRDEVEGLKAFDFVHPDDQAATIEELRKVSRGIKSADFEQRGRHKNGEFRILSWSACAAADGQLIYALGIDVTASKLAGAELRRQNDELERFNRVAVGRELEMISLKQKVNVLSRQLGREAPFNLEFAQSFNAAADAAPPVAGGAGEH